MISNLLAFLCNKEYHYGNMHDGGDEPHLSLYILQFVEEKTCNEFFFFVLVILIDVFLEVPYILLNVIKIVNL